MDMAFLCYLIGFMLAHEPLTYIECGLATIRVSEAAEALWGPIFRLSGKLGAPKTSCGRFPDRREAEPLAIGYRKKQSVAECFRC
jgi:hypothetical protein